MLSALERENAQKHFTNYGTEGKLLRGSATQVKRAAPQSVALGSIPSVTVIRMCAKGHPLPETCPPHRLCACQGLCTGPDMQGALLLRCVSSLHGPTFLPNSSVHPQQAASRGKGIQEMFRDDPVL